MHILYEVSRKQSILFFNTHNLANNQFSHYHSNNDNFQNKWWSVCVTIGPWWPSAGRYCLKIERNVHHRTMRFKERISIMVWGIVLHNQPTNQQTNFIVLGVMESMYSMHATSRNIMREVSSQETEKSQCFASAWFYRSKSHICLVLSGRATVVNISLTCASPVTALD